MRELYNKILKESPKCRITVFTNGYAWSSEDLISWGYADKIDVLFLTIYGHNNESYYKICRTFKDGFNKILLLNYPKMLAFSKEHNIDFRCRLNLTTAINPITCINKVLSVLPESQSLIVSRVQEEFEISNSDYQSIKNHYKDNKRLIFY